ncbi:MAG: transcriptional regulator [Betaproteobacteria bacterium RBG_16_58_11]|nr:MAG: transcriptional regulator [Betaproteobacteria bacterium RBG_16_58_11]
MRKVIIKTGTEEDFFKRGRKVAKLADLGAHLTDERIISFEDPADLLRLLTTARLALFRAIKERPGSITDMAERLHRDRSAVKRDVDELEKVGLVRVEPKTLPGHGRMKEVSVAANQFRLEAQLA